jgi:hypothetical protein
LTTGFGNKCDKCRTIAQFILIATCVLRHCAVMFISTVQTQNIHVVAFSNSVLDYLPQARSRWFQMLSSKGNDANGTYS